MRGPAARASESSESSLGKVMDWLSWKRILEKDEKAKKIGDGDPRQERSCESFKVFMLCSGLLTSEKKIAFLGPESTVNDARTAYGRPMRQAVIVDADGYQLNPGDYLWQHSKNCSISLVFKDDLVKEGTAGLESVTGGLQTGIDFMKRQAGK